MLLPKPQHLHLLLRKHPLINTRVEGTRDKGRSIVTINNAPLDLAPSLVIATHSADAPDWGHHGGAPAQTALAILLETTNPDYAQATYQSFKHDVLATIQYDAWHTGVFDIQTWLLARVCEGRTRSIPIIEGPSQGHPPPRPSMTNLDALQALHLVAQSGSGSATDTAFHHLFDFTTDPTLHNASLRLVAGLNISSHVDFSTYDNLSVADWLNKAALEDTHHPGYSLYLATAVRPDSQPGVDRTR